MKTIEAFGCFISQILEGKEGVFWSELSDGGEERWIFGVGEPIKADFSAGPFPFFSVTDFFGEKSAFLYFQQWYSSEDSSQLKESSKNLSETMKPLKMSSNETKESFCEKVKQVRQFAEDGEVWVLNLAHELSEEMKDEKDLLRAFHNFLSLKRSHSGGVWWIKEHKFCSFSPEVFLHQEGNTLSTFPIKGTGGKKSLEEDEKEKSELSMVTDLLRNDLGQIAEKVWVENERVLTDQKDFYHAHARIFAELPSDTLSWEDYQKLLPAGSISGAPKKRVVEKILELESFDRQFYTGTFGVKFSPTESVFNILIRTLFLFKNKVSYPVGAGLTYESVASQEWEETLAKAKVLEECMGEVL